MTLRSFGAYVKTCHRWHPWVSGDIPRKSQLLSAPTSCTVDFWRTQHMYFQAKWQNIWQQQGQEMVYTTETATVDKMNWEDEDWLSGWGTKK